MATTTRAIKILASIDLVVPHYDAKAVVAFTNALVIDFDQAKYEELHKLGARVLLIAWGSIKETRLELMYSLSLWAHFVGRGQIVDDGKGKGDILSGMANAFDATQIPIGKAQSSKSTKDHETSSSELFY